MSIPENEVAADNQRRRMEEASKSPVGSVIGNAVSLASPALTVGSAVIASGASAGTGLAIAGGVVAGLGIVEWFRKLGASKFSENLEILGQATENALTRVEASLRVQGRTIDALKARIESQEFKNGMASASLQALRTTQDDRLKRMALILANGAKEGDLEPESLDDMMRAAVQLKEIDIQLLRRLYDSQAGLLASHKSLSSEWSQQVALGWSNSFSSLDSLDARGSRGSLARLQASGFIQEVRTMMTPTGRMGTQPFGLLPEGKKFYESLREIAAK